MDREAIECTILNLSEIVLKVLDDQGGIKETELFTAGGRDFQIHFIPYSDARMTDIIVAEMNRRHGVRLRSAVQRALDELDAMVRAHRILGYETMAHGIEQDISYPLRAALEEGIEIMKNN